MSCVDDSFAFFVQKQLQEYDFQFSAWPTDFDVADVEGYVLLHVVFPGSGLDPDSIRSVDPDPGGQK
jgi:hypothetical protein